MFLSFLFQTDGCEKGSLFWVVNHTSTPFGKRLLKKWISQPLREIRYFLETIISSKKTLFLEYPCSVFSLVIFLPVAVHLYLNREIEERLDAVTELCQSESSCLAHLKNLLTRLPDLERGLCMMYHMKVN